MNENKPFNKENIQKLFYYGWHRNTLAEVANILNGIAEDFYKERTVPKNEIVPFEHTQIKHKLLGLEVGDCMFTDDESLRDRTKTHSYHAKMKYGRVFTTRKNDKGWTTWRIK
jgi:hypothetical protein